MPRYYCDYCDTFLTHESPVVRKQHNSGFKHKANVRNYYMQFEESQTQSAIDDKIMQFAQHARPALNLSQLPGVQLPGGQPPGMGGGMFGQGTPGARPPMGLPPTGQPQQYRPISLGGPPPPSMHQYPPPDMHQYRPPSMPPPQQFRPPVHG